MRSVVFCTPIGMYVYEVESSDTECMIEEFFVLWVRLRDFDIRECSWRFAKED